MKKFSNKQIQIMRLAMGMSGVGCNDAVAETILLVHDGMKRLKDKFSLRDAVDIEYYIEQKYKPKKVITVTEAKPKDKQSRPK